MRAACASSDLAASSGASAAAVMAERKPADCTSSDWVAIFKVPSADSIIAFSWAVRPAMLSPARPAASLSVSPRDSMRALS